MGGLEVPKAGPEDREVTRKPAWLVNATRRLALADAGNRPGELVIVESPFAGDRRTNRAYLRACLRDSLKRGEFPFASHAIYTQVLDDDDPEERNLGIRAGLAWGRKAAASVIYADRGISKGMALGIVDANEHGRPVILRYLRGRWASNSRRG